jgi:hypothetical protein
MLKFPNTLGLIFFTLFLIKSYPKNGNNPFMINYVALILTYWLESYKYPIAHYKISVYIYSVYSYLYISFVITEILVWTNFGFCFILLFFLPINKFIGSDIGNSDKSGKS